MSLVSSTLQNASNDKVYKAAVKSIFFLSAKEVEVSGGKKSIIIFVPVKFLKTLHSNNVDPWGHGLHKPNQTSWLFK